MSLLLIAILVLLATIPALIFKKKFNIDVHGPLCLWKTKRTLGLIEKLSKRKRIWKVLADLGIVFAFGILGAGFLVLDRKKGRWKAVVYYLVFAVVTFFIIILPLTALKSIVTGIVTLTTGLGGFAFLALLEQSITIITKLSAGASAAPGVAPVIPGVDVPGSPLHVPLYAVIGLVILLIVHEWGHGIVARAEEITVKSVGLVTLGVFPIGAFTEPDEEELEETTRRKRSRVYSIGSMMNLTTAFVFGLILLLPLYQFVLPGLQQQSLNNIEYLEINKISDSSSLKGKISPGTKVYNVKDVYNSEANQRITLKTNKGIFQAKTNQYGQVGLEVREVEKGPLGLGFWSQWYFIGIVTWIVILNFLIGVINYLPFAIFDGARLIKDISGFYAGKAGLKADEAGKYTSIILSIAVTVLLVINALPYFF